MGIWPITVARSSPLGGGQGTPATGFDPAYLLAANGCHPRVEPGRPMRQEHERGAIFTRSVLACPLIQDRRRIKY
jgi:hypothetical protein